MGYTRIMTREISRYFSLSLAWRLTSPPCQTEPRKPTREPASSVRESEKGKDLKDSFPFGRSSMWVSLDRTTRYLATHPSRLTAPLGAIESCGRVQAFFVATFFFDRKSSLDLLQLSSFLPFLIFEDGSERET